MPGYQKEPTYRAKRINPQLPEYGAKVSALFTPERDVSEIPIEPPKAKSIQEIIADGNWPCLLCGGPCTIPPWQWPGNDPKLWENPDTIPVALVRFDLHDTAMLHTIQYFLAKMLNKPEVLESRAMALVELMRLFLRSGPVAESGFWQESGLPYNSGVDYSAPQAGVSAVVNTDSSGNVDIDENADDLYNESGGELYAESSGEDNEL